MALTENQCALVSHDARSSSFNNRPLFWQHLAIRICSLYCKLFLGLGVFQNMVNCALVRAELIHLVRPCVVGRKRHLRAGWQRVAPGDHHGASVGLGEARPQPSRFGISSLLP